jgi:hypothetical protein
MSEQRTLAQKLLSVQRTIGKLTKDSNNPFFKSKYSDLNQVLALAKEYLNPEGVVIVQGPGMNEHGRYVETALIDADSGQSIVCRVPYSGNEKDAQQIGASTTYNKRTGLKSLLAMEEVDDDGETAVGRGRDIDKPASAGKTQGNSRPTGHSGITIQAPKIPDPTKPPVGKPVSKGPSPKDERETILKKISLTSKVLVDSKRATQEQLFDFLKEYEVRTKEELDIHNARCLLKQLEEILNK